MGKKSIMCSQESHAIDHLLNTLELRNEYTAKYENLIYAIKLAIDENVLLPGTSLPGERKLAEMLNCSRTTVRKAIDALVSDGVLSRRHGARTSVSSKLKKQISNLLGFSEDIRSRGMRPGMKLLGADVQEPSDQERRKLQLVKGAKIIKIRRVRFADGRPIALETAVIPHSIVNSPDAIGPSLYATLDALGKLPDHGVQRISAGAMDAAQAEILETKPGTPVLIVERCCETADGEPIEYTITHYNAEVFDFVTELLR
tara:strand:- start:2431 stop:3204 length:774 start_codon:yes stop_codon:yes gene_type:complete